MCIGRASRILRDDIEHTVSDEFLIILGQEMQVLLHIIYK
jgi:hypothetical protein